MAAGGRPLKTSSHPSGPFAPLGRFILRHAKLVIVVWVLFLLPAVVFLLPHIGDSTTPSALSIPNSAPSSQETQMANRVFPNASASADTLVLLTGPNITSAQGRNVTLGLTRWAQNDPTLQGLLRVESLYTAYQEYLDGRENASLTVLQVGFLGNASVYDGVNGTTSLLWGTAGLYLYNWGNLFLGNPFVPSPSVYNYPAYYETAHNATVAKEPASLQALFQQNLSLFYQGYPRFSNTSVPNGWNATNGCWTSVYSGQGPVLACTDTMVRALHADPRTAGLSGFGPFDTTVLSEMKLENLSKGGNPTTVNVPVVRNATVHYLAVSSGIPYPSLNATLNLTNTTFHTLTPSFAQLSNWSGALVGNGTVSTYATPVPASILSTFVDGAWNNATVVVFVFPQGQSDQGPQAETVVSELDRLTPLSLAVTDPQGQYHWVQTGDAALVITESNTINQDTDAILPITIVLLLTITGLYFRAPLTPVLVILTIGLALLLGLAAMVITTHFFGLVTQSTLTLLLTFTLGVGTDYSVFLTARYREELWSGRSHEEAIVNAVTWAGESIATSGSTVVLATLAMAFSGASLISDWGRILSSGVTIAVLVALTLVPAVLYLIGPRLFWPYTGKRFERQAQARREASRRRNTYFHRASRFSTRRPAVVLTLAALVSLPLVYLALTAPLSYSYFGQLPPNSGPAEGLTQLSGNFGPGYVFPLDILVTFQQPLVPSCPGPGAGGLCTPTQVNVGELAQANEIALLLNHSSGVRSVDSLFGTGGAPLSTWLNITGAKPVPQQTLMLSFSSYVGNDSRTVWYRVALDTNGNTNQAVSYLNAIEGNLSAYASSHPAVTATYYGGAASITKDLQNQLAESSVRMEIIIVVGLLIVLFLALGSASLPPLALITIALSAAWSWALSYALFVLGFGLSLFFYIPPVLFLLIMGLGMDYNIFILTRIREERLKGSAPKRAVVDAVAHTAGIITAAAVILGGAFFALLAAQVTLLRVLGFAVGAAVILDAAVVRTYIVPAILGAAGDRIWWAPRWLRGVRRDPASVPVRKMPVRSRASTGAKSATASPAPSTESTPKPSPAPLARGDQEGHGDDGAPKGPEA